MHETYLFFQNDSRWALSRLAEGRMIELVAGAPMPMEDIEAILRALGIRTSKAVLDLYFPKQANGRCPTLELMELTSILDPTNPIHKAKHEPVASV